MKLPITDNVELIKNSISRGQSLVENDPEMQKIAPAPEKYEILKKCATSVEVFVRACELFADRPALGYRTQAVGQNPKTGKKELHFLPKFETVTYAELLNRVTRLAAAWQNGPGFNLRAQDMVGIMAFSSPDSAIADFAALYSGATSVPLQKEFSPKDLKQIINDTEFRIFVCGIEQVSLLANLLPETPSIKNVVVIDYCAEDEKQKAAYERAKTEIASVSPDVKVHTIVELETLGQTLPRADMVIPKTGEELMTLTYTSGSTGFPKGAMFPDKVWNLVWKGALTSTIPFLPHSALSYFPLNHILGRITIIQSIGRGGTVFFPASSDMSTLFEDFRLSRPTAIFLVPRVSEMIFQFYQRELAKRPTESETIKQEMRQSFLGDRVLFAVTGSAPTAPEVKEFLKVCFRIPVLEGYGATETVSITHEERIARDCVTDYRLVDVPELGYRTTDQPYPRGELRLKTNRTITGYFKNPAATEALFDEAGFLKTGDIVEERGPDHIVWVDRKNNVLKLSQGEFVTIWRLESIFNSGSPYIKQVYLYGNSSRSYLLGVIVPDADALAAHFAKENKTASPAAVKAVLRGELARITREAELRPYETPRDFIVENVGFTVENGLLTSTNKPARPSLKNKYGAALEKRYVDLEKKQYEDLASLFGEAGEGGKNLSVAQIVTKALEVTLGLSDVDLQQNFSELGGDSLHASTLVEILRSQFNRLVQVGTLLNPAGTLQDVVRELEGKSEAVGFDSIHGAGATTVKAVELKLNRFFSPEEMKDFSLRLNVPVEKTPKVFLLTGASGFLGRFLCLDLLEIASERNGRVHCIIRAKNDQVARERLEESLSTDPKLVARLKKLSPFLEVHAGDLAKPQLGLPTEKYESLGQHVDSIMHGGALVNHSLPYAQLFAPNVLGTVEIIRLALKQRPKTVHFVSSVAVSGLKPRGTGGTVKENEDIRNWNKEYECAGGGYAEGYALSKWASELLLIDLKETFSIPVDVFRCSMILPHREYVGQFNAPDLFTRLICSVVYTGLAPASFYVPSEPYSPHYDGNPVDFVSAAIVAISLTATPGFRTYQVSNPHWQDGISLDSVVDWIESAGYRVKRIPDYQTWFNDFSAALRSLEEIKQRASSLPIIHGWQNPSRADEERWVDAEQFQTRVRRLKPEGESDVPHLSEGFIHKYLRDIQSAGLIEAPPKKKNPGNPSGSLLGKDPTAIL